MTESGDSTAGASDSTAGALDRAVERAFSDRTVTDVESQNTRPGNATARVTVADGESVYLKTTTDGPTRLRREIAATRYAAAQTTGSVPRVVDADVEVPYLVTEPLPGTPLNEPWTGDGDRERLLRAAGRTLARVHEATFDRPGVVDGGDEAGLRLEGASWAETLCRTVEWRAADWFADRFAEIPEQLVELVRELEPDLDGVAPTLLHGDCSRINVHVHPAGLLDWERALVGDPAFDHVDAEGHLVEQVDVDDADEPRFRSAFRDGYRAQAGALPPGLSERRPLYRVFAHLLVPQTFESWAPTVDRPTEELAADVREEFASRVATAREEMG